jgi:hypothetical protein
MYMMYGDFFKKTKNGLTLFEMYAVSKGLPSNALLAAAAIKAQQKTDLFFDNKIEVQ